MWHAKTERIEREDDEGPSESNSIESVLLAANTSSFMHTTSHSLSNRSLAIKKSETCVPKKPVRIEAHAHVISPLIALVFSEYLLTATA